MTDSVFQAPTFSVSLVIRPFLLKLKTITTCFKHDISHSKLKDNAVDKPIHRNVVGCRLFCGDNFIFKNFKKCSLVESFLIKTQGYSMQPRTLLNSVTNDFMRVFLNSCTENFRKHPEKHRWWSSLLIQLHKYSLQPAIGKKSIKLFWRCSEWKGCSKTSKNSRKIFAELSFFL